MSTVAIVGAGEELAEEVLSELLARGHEPDTIRLFGGEGRAGEVMMLEGSSFRVDPVSAEALADFESILFFEDGLLARDHVPALADAGALVVDATAYSRRTRTGNLVVPEVNGAVLSAPGEQRVFALPMPASTGLATALAPLHALARINRVVTTIFDPASNRGAAAIEDLSRQSVAMVSGEGIDREKYPETLAFNVRPYSSGESDDGWAFDERMVAEEVATLFGEPPVEVLATAVRVPVFLGAAQSVWVDLDGAVTLEDIRTALRGAPSLLLAGDSLGDVVGDETGDLLADNEPGPVDVAGSSAIHLARLRQDPGRPESIGFWLAFDDLRKGVALNAVTTLERCTLESL